MKGECECWAGYAGPDCTTSVPKPNDNSPVGVGLSGLSYWSTQWMYVDAMMSSSAFVSNLDVSQLSVCDACDALDIFLHAMIMCRVLCGIIYVVTAEGDCVR